MHDKYSLQIKDGIFHYDDIEKSKFTIEMIAHGLSGINRFNGHNDVLFPVLNHSILVENLMKENNESPRMRMIGLLHDAQEIIVSDVTRPMKAYYRDFEHVDLNTYADKVDHKIYNDLGIESMNHDEHVILKHYDNWALFNEKTYTFKDQQEWSWSMPLIGRSKFKKYTQFNRKYWIKKYIELFHEVKRELV